MQYATNYELMIELQRVSQVREIWETSEVDTEDLFYVATKLKKLIERTEEAITTVPDAVLEIMSMRLSEAKSFYLTVINRLRN